MNSSKEVDALVADLKAQGVTKVEAVIRTAETCVGWPYVWGATGALCTPSKREYYANRSVCPAGEAEQTRKKCQVLNGSKSACSGCKYLPDGEKTEIHDCWGFIKDILQRFGVNLAGGGCTSGWNNDSNWTEKGAISTLPERLCCVFWTDSSDKSKKSHIGFYIGGGIMVHCSGEVKEEKLSKRCTDWAIPKGLDGDLPVKKPTLRKGNTGPYVVECQEDLITLGYDLRPYGADGKYGNTTIREVKKFQNTHIGPDGKQLVADGVTGQNTWWALDKAVGPQPGPVPLYTATVPPLTMEQAEALIAQYPGATKTEEVG